MSATYEYVVMDGNGLYYVPCTDSTKSLQKAKTWKTRKGAQNTADIWGCNVKLRKPNTVVKVEVRVTRKVTRML